jgi:hypothetical protein
MHSPTALPLPCRAVRSPRRDCCGCACTSHMCPPHRSHCPRQARQAHAPAVTAASASPTAAHRHVAVRHAGTSRKRPACPSPRLALAAVPSHPMPARRPPPPPPPPPAMQAACRCCGRRWGVAVAWWSSGRTRWSVWSATRRTAGCGTTCAAPAAPAAAAGDAPQRHHTAIPTCRAAARAAARRDAAGLDLTRARPPSPGRVFIPTR